MKVLEVLGYSEPKEQDIELVQQICQVMSERAARLAAAGLAAIVKVRNTCMVLARTYPKVSSKQAISVTVSCLFFFTL